MTTHPRPWLQCVNLHPDVLSDGFSEDLFALDLGTLADYLVGKDLDLDIELGRVPTVYRDADNFFAASYLTNGLRSLLEDVLGRLAGTEGNRVLRLQTPFGGGKSHTLAALLHAARSRTSLDVFPDARELPRPNDVRVAVVDGQFFDPTTGKQLPGENGKAKTLWGWIAWALRGQEGYELVRIQDEAKVAPGGDQLIELLQSGSNLILIDELLQYLISAGGIRVEQTTLRDETLSFLHRLTAAVGSVKNAVLVYSLQSSKRESLEYSNLLRTIEHFGARKDQRREPVQGNEILQVIQRRLLANPPKSSEAMAAADAYRKVFTQMRRAYAHGDIDDLQAEEQGLALQERIKDSYPFHPALIDLMRERWASIPEFQRTRGALRFLASCLRAAHRTGVSRLLLGPGDVQIQEFDVRLAFFKEVGQGEQFQACLEHDFIGSNSRVRRIDERRAREVTTEAGKQPATRLATTMLLYSFGGLRRGETDNNDLLPPGIGEPDLLDVSIGPDLDTSTMQACLKELKEQCLYLHYDGSRYSFKNDPNVTLLVEQEAEIIARDENRIHERIRKMIEERLAGCSAIVWPMKSADIRDLEPEFVIAYLPLEFAVKSKAEQQHAARSLCEEVANRPRRFRNGLALAIPKSDQVEILRRSVRYLLAVERVQTKWREHNLTSPQKTQLKERNATEMTAMESALLKLYDEVWLPASGDRSLSLDKISLSGRPLQATLDSKKHALIHQRLMELLTTVQRRVFSVLAPGKIVELFNLGEPGSYSSGITCEDVLAGFFEFIGFPRLLTSDVVRSSIARGVERGLFGFMLGRPQLGEDNRYQVDLNRIAYERHVEADEIDLETGFLIHPNSLPVNQTEPQTETNDDEDKDPNEEEQPESLPREKTQEIALSFEADTKKLYDAWPALANLADLAATVSIHLGAKLPTSIDEGKLENGVLEPLRELGIIEED